MKRLMRRIFRLTWIAVSGPGAWRGFLTYGVVLALQFFGVWISVRMITWNKAFYDALENMDAAGAVQQIWIFAGLTALSAGSFLIGDWLRKRLQMRWRSRLTQRALDLWVGGRAYWALRPGMSPAAIDNPDQRVAEDCRLFVNRLLMETLDLISSIVALVSYVALLWSLSSFPLAFTLGGIAIEIPRYMVWAAFLYVALSSVITHLLGKPLKSVIFTQEKREADFRHALIQLREGAAVIAQAGGEAAEQRRLDRLFDAIRQNWFRLVNKELVLGLFSRPYMQTVLRIPTFLALPAYFAGAVTLGGLMQLASAFSNVATTLSWFIFSYRDLAEFVAVSERLDGLFAAGADPVPMPDAPRAVSHAAGAAIATAGLQLHTPEGRALAATPDLAIAPGDRVWIRGASGEGKSTLLAALSGLWPYGHGRITAPADLMVLPQTPRIFPEGLLAAAAYPQPPEHYGDAAIRGALAKVGLGQLTEDRPLSDLSGGERQRLALARALLARPAWLALDEATSALDAAAEEEMIALLLRELPDTTLIAVSHRATPAMAGWREIAIG